MGWAAFYLACVGIYLAHAAATAFLQDDAFIFLRYAQNWVAGDGLVWNPGERVEGYTSLLLNLEKTEIVTSIGVAILFEIIERMSNIEGTLAFCNLTPTIDKTFHIMDVSPLTSIYPDEAAALDQAKADG